MGFSAPTGPPPVVARRPGARPRSGPLLPGVLPGGGSGGALRGGFGPFRCASPSLPGLPIGRRKGPAPPPRARTGPGLSRICLDGAGSWQSRGERSVPPPGVSHLAGSVRGHSPETITHSGRYRETSTTRGTNIRLHAHHRWIRLGKRSTIALLPLATASDSSGEVRTCTPDQWFTLRADAGGP